MIWITAFKAIVKSLVTTITEAPVKLSRAASVAAAHHRQMEALRLVTTAQFAPGVDRKALCNAILRAKRVELFDWYTHDRFVRIELGEGHGLLLVHTADPYPLYAVTDMTMAWHESFYVPVFGNGEDTTIVN